MGTAFDDAYSILTNRYAGNVMNLPSALSFLLSTNAYTYQNDGFDTYSDGPLMDSQYLSYPDSITADNIYQPWPGSDNPQVYYNLISELFGANKTHQRILLSG